MNGDRTITYANMPWPGEKLDFQSTAFIWKLLDDGNSIKFTIQRAGDPQSTASVTADVGTAADGSKILLGCDEWGSAANCSYDDINVYSLNQAD
jgi:hypothetical protein